MIKVRTVEHDERETINSIVSIHLHTFNGFFLTFMGRGFLNQMYQSYCNHDDSGLYVAEDDGKPVGFLAYSSDFSSLYKYMIKTRLIPFAFYSIGAFFRKPVTVTHPDIIRYFMTIPEAVSLVMEAAAIAHGGEIFVLDMGQPVRIVALAENLLRMYGIKPEIGKNIIFTGLRPGEKIKEELLMNEEGLQKTKNKLIFIGKQIEIDESTFAKRLSKLRDAAKKDDDKTAIKAMHEMVPTFTTPEEFNKKVLTKV